LFQEESSPRLQNLHYGKLWSFWALLGMEIYLTESLQRVAGFQSSTNSFLINAVIRTVDCSIPLAKRAIIPQKAWSVGKPGFRP